MQGKVVVITGGTSGIGQAAALELARRGARLVLAARDAGRAGHTLSMLKRLGEQPHRALIGDLSRIDEAKRLGAEIAASEPQIDVLINNAGALFMKREETADGLERTFAVNHMAYFVLTNALFEALKQTPGARIVSTASNAHEAGRINFDDLQSRRAYSGFLVYAKSKLCNVLFTRELARRLAGSGVTANCHHPGFVATRMGANNGALVRFGMNIVALAALSPEEGAQTLVYLATAPEVAEISGRYFVRCKPAKTSPAGADDALAGRLWEESARLCA